MKSCLRALTRSRSSLASPLPQGPGLRGVPVWVGPSGDHGSSPPLSVPIDGSSGKAWQILGDSLGERETLSQADHGEATEAMWRPL